MWFLIVFSIEHFIEIVQRNFTFAMCVSVCMFDNSAALPGPDQNEWHSVRRTEGCVSLSLLRYGAFGVLKQQNFRCVYIIYELDTFRAIC